MVPLAVACTAHAAVFGALGAVTLRPRAIELPEPTATEIDLESNGPIRPTPQSTSRADGAPVASHRTPAIAAAERTEPERAPLATTEVLRNGEQPPVEPPPSEWSLSTTAPLRIDLRASFTPSPVASSDGREAVVDGPRRSRTGGVAEGLAAHDVELGLGRGGPILTALESAARSSDAPVDGSATFEAVVLADAAVTTVNVLSADGETDGWVRVGESAEQSIPPGHVRVPPGTRGWRVVVRVEATTRLADGRPVRSLHGARTSLQPSALQAMMERKPGAQDPPPPVTGPIDDVGASHEPPPVGALGPRSPPKAAGAVVQAIAGRVLPTPTLSANGKVCSLAMGLTPVGVSAAGGCSIENIGTGTTRTVSGRILSEGAL